ncbi:putative quinol monooxygenase [Streptomyces cuspidosporus]|uniref:ABM domain-containing protein n=1 Tax=Streptomyces cuspidosporus TaxID=66882 RepID=A0ABN3H6Y7_9ACTN
MSLVVVAECVARPGREDRLRTALEALIEPSLEEPGCLAYRPYADPNNPGHMVVVAEWTGPEALARHGATPHVHHARQVLHLVLAEPMAVRRLVAQGALAPESVAQGSVAQESVSEGLAAEGLADDGLAAEGLAADGLASDGLASSK